MTYALRAVGDYVLYLFRQDHTAVRYRSRLWFLLPVLFGLLGGLVAFFATRHDDPDKARNCLLLGIILSIPFIVFTAVAVAVVGAVGAELSTVCADMHSTTNPIELSSVENEFIQVLCD